MVSEMTGSLAMTLLSILYSVFLSIIYFSKKHIKSHENALFSILLILNVLGLFTELSCNLVIMNITKDGSLSIFVNKMLLTYFNFYICIYSLYVVTVCYKKEKGDFELFYKRIQSIFLIVWLVAEMSICILPVYIFQEGMSIYSYGPSPNVIYVLTALCVILCIYCLAVNIKDIRHKKYTPILWFVISGFVISAIQKINPALTLAVPMETFTLFLMYFSIENPDLKLINELNLERDRADKANNAKTEFLSHMSHEVRTPLNAIINFSNSLIEELHDENAKEDAKVIVDASKSLLEIVNGILDISKIEANKIEIVNIEYEPQDMFDSLVALSKARLGSKPIDFRVSFDESIPKYLFGDSSRIKQICVNLLTNSIKYTKEGFIEFKVSSVVSGDVCRLIMSVEDSGIGIKKEDVNKLFDKFSRLDLEKNISIEGSGLGLAITKKLVDMMGGKIVVQSEYGVGSKFTVAIDQRIVAPTKKKDDDFDVSSIVKKEYPNKRVLVIDDNKMNLTVAKKVLEPFKVLVDTAESGDEGIEKIVMNGNYDLVLLDDMMPNKTGVETLKELKENMEDYKTPTVALTANAIVGMKEKYLEEGFDDYLAKPIEKDELKRVLNKFLKEK